MKNVGELYPHSAIHLHGVHNEKLYLLQYRKQNTCVLFTSDSEIHYTPALNILHACDLPQTQMHYTPALNILHACDLPQTLRCIILRHLTFCMPAIYLRL
jgi:hypothetical protein